MALPIAEILRTGIQDANVFGRAIYELETVRGFGIEDASDTIPQATQSLARGESLIIAYGPHTSIWNYPSTLRRLVRWQIYPEPKSLLDHHFVIASAKYSDDFADIQTMNSGNDVFQQMTRMLGIIPEYMVAENQRNKMKNEMANQPEKLKRALELADSINDLSFRDIVKSLQTGTTLGEVYIDGTRTEGKLYRAEILIDLLYHAYKAGLIPSFNVLPVVMHPNFDRIQPKEYQGKNFAGYDPLVPVGVRILPMKSLEELARMQSRYTWSVESTRRKDQRVTIGDVISGGMIAPNLFPRNDLDPLGIYANFQEKETGL